MRARLLLAVLILALGAAASSAVLVAAAPTHESAERLVADAPTAAAAPHTRERVQRRHVATVRSVAAGHVTEKRAEAAEQVTVRRRIVARREYIAPAPGTTGELYLPDLTRDLHVRIDGEYSRVRRNDLSQGVHSVTLFRKQQELARIDVAIAIDGVTSIQLEDFGVDGVCIARSRFERLANDRESGGCRKTECVTDLGIRWLARHQSASGLWSAHAFQRECRGGTCGGANHATGDMETTALSLLALLGFGDTHNAGHHKDNVKAGLKALRDLQNADGWFGAERNRREHAVATLAMTEAAGLTGSRMWMPSAKRAIAVLLAARPSDDVETAALEACALYSATRCEEWRTEVDPRLADTAHHLASFGPPERWPPRQAALLLASRALLADSPADDPDLLAGASTLIRHLENAIESDRNDGVDALTMYFGSIGAWHLPHDTVRAWSPIARALVIAGQDEGGSWTPRTDGSTGRDRDRLTTTAYHLLASEMHYRYGRVFGGTR